MLRKRHSHSQNVSLEKFWSVSLPSKTVLAKYFSNIFQLRHNQYLAQELNISVCLFAICTFVADLQTEGPRNKNITDTLRCALSIGPLSQISNILSTAHNSLALWLRDFCEKAPFYKSIHTKEYDLLVALVL